jgi:hypothetical protein
MHVLALFVGEFVDLCTAQDREITRDQLLNRLHDHQSNQQAQTTHSSLGNNIGDRVFATTLSLPEI